MSDNREKSAALFELLTNFKIRILRSPKGRKILLIPSISISENSNQRVTYFINYVVLNKS